MEFFFNDEHYQLYNSKARLRITDVIKFHVCKHCLPLLTSKDFGVYGAFVKKNQHFFESFFSADILLSLSGVYFVLSFKQTHHDTITISPPRT